LELDLGMKIFAVEYSGKPFEEWANLGDDIQTIAAKRLLPRVDGCIPKDQLSTTKECGLISLNGFFLGGAGWPPAPGLVPFFYSFHLSSGSQDDVCSEENLAYFRRYAPIGCRDQGTLKILQSHGVDAYCSKCISLTFPKRQCVPKNGKIFLVSLNEGAVSAIPRKLRKKAVVVEQAKLRLPFLSGRQREGIAQHLLDIYAREASLIITSKIHCAMPCIAMGIPVVFLYDRKKKEDHRVEIIKELIGINYLGESRFSGRFINPLIGRLINWKPAPLDIEEEKERIKEGYLRSLSLAIERYPQE
jgi:hypothetical protein